MRRGFTLIELLVSMGILLIASVMMVSLFIPSMSLFRKQTGKSDSYRGCLMLMEKFRLGLLNSQMETVTVEPNGQAISWQLIQESPPFSASSGDALMAPQFSVFYYQPSEGRVYLKKYDVASPLGPTQPAILSQVELTQAMSSSSSGTRVLARNITEFQISDKDGNLGLLDPPLSLAITCEIDTKGTQTKDVETFNLTTSVTPRSMRW